MFRYATYAKLGSHNLIVVGKNGEEFRIITGSYAELVYHFEACSAVGFYFEFPAKYHPIAYSFFCRLSDISDFWSAYCPVKILLELAKHRSLSRTIFHQKYYLVPHLTRIYSIIAAIGGLYSEVSSPPIPYVSAGTPFTQ